jgi:hypothetical protein
MPVGVVADDLWDENLSKMGDHDVPDTLTSVFGPVLYEKTTGSSTGASPYTTASVDFVNSRLYLVAIHQFRSATVPTVSSITGGGLTWKKVRSETDTSTIVRTDVWCGMVSSGATSGALTITTSSNPEEIAWQIEEGIGFLNDGTDGLGAIASVTARSWDAGVARSPQIIFIDWPAPGATAGVSGGGRWILPNTDLFDPSNLPSMGAAASDNPEFFGEHLPLRGDYVDYRTNSNTAFSKSAVDLPQGQPRFLNQDYNVSFGAFCHSSANILTKGTGFTLLSTTAGATQLGWLAEWKLPSWSIADGAAIARQQDTPYVTNSLGFKTAGVALELRWDGVTVVPPATGHVYLIKHMKVINTRTSANRVQIYQNSATVDKVLFDVTMGASSWAEHNGMWIVNAGDDIRSISSADNSAHILLYGLDLTT